MTNPAQYFPQEVFLNILSYTNLEDLLNCASVNKEWKIMAEDNVLWRNIVPNDSIPKGVDAKKYFHERAVVSQKGVSDALFIFAQEVKAASGIGEFTLYCTSEPEYKRSTRLVCEKTNSVDEKNMKEFCVYIKNIPEFDWVNGKQVMNIHYQDMKIQIVEKSIIPVLFHSVSFLDPC